jgi:hypothetical protein
MTSAAPSSVGMHVSAVAALREVFGLERRPVRVIDPGQMLGEIDEELKRVIGIDTEGVFRRMTRFGFPADGWKPWRMFDGLEVLVPGGFNPDHRRQRRRSLPSDGRRVVAALRAHAGRRAFFR